MKGKGHWYGQQNKEIVVGVRQRKGGLRLVHTKDAKAVTLKAVIETHVSPDVEFVMTDTTSAATSALKALGHGEKHHEINHITRQYVNGIVHTNTIESAFSLLKRGIVGNFHKVSIKHLQRYLNEFSYRFNRREDADAFIETDAAALRIQTPDVYRSDFREGLGFAWAFFPPCISAVFFGGVCSIRDSTASN